ncbi:MAG: DUF1844 domain-containing protein [Candidatus Omnitrophota bacterium]
MGEEKIDKQKLSELMFIQYISALVNSGMQQLGKVMNPMTGKIEKNLEAVQGVIELISMLKEKTKGNLSDNEARVIADGLANLQLNYADEVAREGKEKPKEVKDK